MRGRFSECPCYAARLWRSERQRKLAPLRRRIEFPLATIARPLHLNNIVGVDQLFENTSQTLLGDLQHVEKFCHGQSRPPVDEVHDPVVRSPETVFGEDLIRVRREVAIGKEEKLDDAEVDAFMGRQRGSDRLAGLMLRFGHAGLDSCFQFYVSLVDIK